MDSLILNIISSLHQVKGTYDELSNENEQLKKEVETLKHKKDVIDTLKIYNEDTNTKEDISEEDAFKYGKGVIRYKLGDTYYHGLGQLEVSNKPYPWQKIPGDKHYHIIIEYKKDHCLYHIEWGTHSAEAFCSNCTHEVELSKRARVLSYYKCQGHPIS